MLRFKPVCEVVSDTCRIHVQTGTQGLKNQLEILSFPISFPALELFLSWDTKMIQNNAKSFTPFFHRSRHVKKMQITTLRLWKLRCYCVLHTNTGRTDFSPQLDFNSDLKQSKNNMENQKLSLSRRNPFSCPLLWPKQNDCCPHIHREIIRHSFAYYREGNNITGWLQLNSE